MAAWALLCSLLLAALGVTAAAFALNAYLADPLSANGGARSLAHAAPKGGASPPDAHRAAASASLEAAGDRPPPAVSPAMLLAARSKAHFVLVEPSPAAPANPPARAAQAKPKALARAKAPSTERRPPAKAAAWPWSLIN
jgi:hypothetical protein